MFKFDYDKLHLKEITVLVPRGAENLISALTPVLGLYGINVKDFLIDFELKTQFAADLPDLLIPVRVKISKIKTFETTIKTPYLATIIPTELTILEVYKLFLIKSVLVKNKYVFYITFRRYLNQVAAIMFSENAGENRLNIVKSKYLSNRFDSLRLLSNRVRNLNYGVFFNWNNSNTFYVNTFRYQLQVRDLSFFKLNKFFKQLVPSVVGNAYVFSSYSLSIILHPMRVFLGLLRRSNYYPLFYKFGYNLVSSLNSEFIQSVLDNFLSWRIKLRIYLLRVLNHLLVTSVLLLNLFRKKIALLLHAYISTNCKIS